MQASVTTFKTLKPCLESATNNQDEVVCGIQNTGAGYSFTSFATQESFVNYLLSGAPDSKFANELLCGPTLSFFDFDAKCSLEELQWQTIKALVGFLTDFLQKSYKKYLNVTLKKKSFKWSNSTRPDKVSLHCVIQHADFFWSAERRCELKHFVQQLSKDSLNFQGLYTYEDIQGQLVKKTIFDPKIYSRNRLFRCLGCSKRQHNVPLTPFPSRPITLKLLLDHLVSVVDTDERTELRFKKQHTVHTSETLDKNVLESIAREHGATISKTEGCLIICKNLTKTRTCTLTGTVHEHNNCYMVKTHNELLFFCHGCPGKHKVVHTFSEASEFGTYESYKRLLCAWKKEHDSVTETLIRDYMKQSIVFIDQPGDPHYCTKTTVPCDGFKNKLFGKGIVQCQNLFARSSDIVLKDGDDVLKFSSILADLSKTRELPSYNKTVWLPHCKRSKYRPVVDKNTLNVFPGFALTDVETDWKAVDFKKTHVYRLLFENLCNEKQDCYDYLERSIAMKLQKSWVKLPICHIWCGSKPGVGKSSLLTFLSRMFTVGMSENEICLSFSNIGSFCHRFNNCLSKNLWVSLEEVKSNGKLTDFDNYLKDFVSNPFVINEKKGIDKEYKRNYSTCLLFSNERTIVKCDSLDRRMVFYETGGKQNRNTAGFFDKLYAEFDSIPVMKACFEHFLAVDLEAWNYRQFPVTKIRKKIIACSRDINVRFGLFLYKSQGAEVRLASAYEIYGDWEIFCDEHGVTHYRRDSNYVCSMLELTFDLPFDGNVYTLQRTKFAETLRDLCGDDILPPIVKCPEKVLIATKLTTTL